MAIDMPVPVYDKEDQLKQVEPWIIDGEHLLAVFDCKGSGTGFVAVSDKRLLFYDKAFMRKRKALVSIPFTRITAVSSVDEGGFLSATSILAINASGAEYEFEFRGGEKAHTAYMMIMRHLLND